MNVKQDWERGVHSNIPPCCIFWYLIRKRSGWVSVISNKYIYPIWCLLVPVKQEYIRCPFCILTGHAVALHKCSVQCVNIKGAIFRQRKRCAIHESA